MSIATQLSFSTATSVLAGTAGALLYQQSVGATTFLSIATTSGWVLQSTGSVPQWTPASSVGSGSATNLAGGAASQIPYQTGAGATSFIANGTAGTILTSNGASVPSWNNTLTLASTNQAGTTNTGALIVPFGGVGIGGNLVVGGASTLTGAVIAAAATQATSTATGALTVPYGGAGIGGNLYVGGGASIAGITTVTNSGAASSTATGALRVTGGVGIGGNLYVGGNTVVTGNLTIQGTTVIVDSTVTNIADPIFILGTTASGGVQVVDDNRDRGIAFYYFSATNKIGFFGYDDSTNFWTFVPDATITGEIVSGTKGAVDVNLAGGTAQSIHYQSAANTTAFLAASSTSGWVLQSLGTGAAPVWGNPAGISAGSATAADTVKTVYQPASATYYPTFVDSNNASATAETVYTTSSFVINPSTNVVGIGTSTISGSNTKLEVFAAATGVIKVSSHAANNTSLRGYTIGISGDATEYFWMKAAPNSGEFQFNAGYATWGGYQTFYTNGLERLRIDSSGNVGVGTTTIGAKLDLYNATDAGSGANGIRVQRPGSYGQYGYLEYLASSDKTVLGTVYTGGTATGYGQIYFRQHSNGGTVKDTMVIDGSNNVGIGTTAPAFKLEVNGSFAATTKSFVINHPTKPGMKLRYGSLEGPENGVYVRGKLTNGNTIKLPDYWTGLVDPDSITVDLTPIGKHQKLFVKEITDNQVIVGIDGMFNTTINCFYTVWAERKDVEKLVVEYE